MRSRLRPHSWKNKFGHALRGLQRAFRTQHSFAIHIFIACVAVVAATVFSVTIIEWGLIVAAIGMVLVAETFNTAIESLARAVDTQFHPRLRDALDIASAAVLLASGTAVVIGLCIFVPALYRLLYSVL
ncbi:MAG: diacylglycerol kinase family protein [Pirellulales bacterium]|jgi:diacylglycerol kinase|tara:strand:+ start:499 stop:885 length:387 start_codon:yes stop_codon:yes gene_type:complete